MKSFLLSTFAVFVFINANAQLPNSDVWLFSYSAKNGIYTFKDGKNISNHPGYDNQPFFSKDGKQLLFTSERDSGQTEIFNYSLITGISQQYTHSATSEYSPEFIPNSSALSAVVVEKDSTQRFWEYKPLKGNENSYTANKSIFPSTKQVAYARWMNDTVAFLCLLPEPMSLYLANIHSPWISKCAMNVNRSMCVYHEEKKDLFLYSQMKSDSTYMIQALTSKGLHDPEFTPIPFVKGSQDFTVDNSGNIFMASGTKLFIWTIGKSKDWKEIADFSTSGLTRITRLMVSPDGKHLAVVDNTK